MKRKSQLNVSADVFAKQIGGPVIRIPHRPEAWAAPGQCLNTATEMAEEHGGAVQHGWQITAVYRAGQLEWLVAQHHTVWRNLEGQLIDVTPYPEGSGLGVVDGHTLFVADEGATWIEQTIERLSRPINLSRPNKYFAVRNTPQVRATIEQFKRAERQCFPDDLMCQKT